MHFEVNSIIVAFRNPDDYEIRPMRTHMVVREVRELHRETGSLEDPPIFQDTVRRIGRSIGKSCEIISTSGNNGEPRSTQPRVFRANTSRGYELSFFLHAGQPSLIPSAMSRSYRTSGGTPRLTVRPFQGVLGSLPVTRHVSFRRLRLQQHHKHRRDLRDVSKTSKFRLRAITCVQHVFFDRVYRIGEAATEERWLPVMRESRSDLTSGEKSRVNSGRFYREIIARIASVCRFKFTV